MSALDGLRAVELADGLAGAVAGVQLADCGAEVATISAASFSPMGAEAFRHRDRGSLIVEAVEPGAPAAKLARLEERVRGADAVIPGDRRASPRPAPPAAEAPAADAGAVVARMPTAWLDDPVRAGDVERHGPPCACAATSSRQRSCDGSPVEMIGPYLRCIQGVRAAASILSVLQARDESAAGQEVVVSGIHATMICSSTAAAANPNAEETSTRAGAFGRRATYRPFRAGCGGWVASGALGPRFVGLIIGAPGLGRILDEPRAGGNPDAATCPQNFDRATTLFEDARLRDTVETREATFRALGIPVEPIRTRDGPMDHDQVQANGLDRRLDAPGPEEGLALSLRRAETADVAIDGMRPGKMAQLGLDRARLEAWNPGIIGASLSACGTKGARAMLPGVDTMVQGLTGIMAAQGAADAPCVSSAVHVDVASACLGACAAALALEERRRSGRGQAIEEALPRTACFMPATQASSLDGAASLEQGCTDCKGPAEHDRLHAVADGWGRVAAPSGAAILQAPGGAGSVAGAPAGLSAAEALGRLADAGIAAVRVRRIKEILRDPRFIASGQVVPAAGELHVMPMVGRPAGCSAGRKGELLQPPGVGRPSRAVPAEGGHRGAEGRARGRRGSAPRPPRHRLHPRGGRVRRAAGGATPCAAPERAPDFEAAQATRLDQALLYRLNGDRNPLHSDPAFARGGGLERRILHGPRSFGFAARALADHAPFPTADRGRISGRFAAPVLPGDALTARGWIEDGRVLFRTLVGGRVALGHGLREARA